jgi:hypothetical protein
MQGWLDLQHTHTSLLWFNPMGLEAARYNLTRHIEVRRVYTRFSCEKWQNAYCIGIALLIHYIHQSRSNDRDCGMSTEGGARSPSNLHFHGNSRPGLSFEVGRRAPGNANGSKAATITGR